MKSPTTWRNDLHRLEGLNLPLLPCGAGDEGKSPINPKNGMPLSGWPTATFTVAAIAAMNGFVRSVGTRTGAGLLCFDLDGGTAVELALEHGCDPTTSATWQVHRTTDPLRLKVIFRLTPVQQAELGEVNKKAHTKDAIKDKNGKVLKKAEAVEVFHSGGKQVLLLGEHPPSGGAYIWPDGLGPEALALIPPQWFGLAVQVAAGSLGINAKAGNDIKPRSGSSSKGEWRSLYNCPICTRDTTGYCSQHRTDGTIRCFHGSTFSPEQRHGILRLGQTITGTDGITYGYCGSGPQGNGDEFSTFRIHRPRDPSHQGRAVNNIAMSIKEPVAEPTEQDDEEPPLARWQAATKPPDASQPSEPSFEQRWEALELHAAELACNSWTVMKSVVSLASKASELDLSRLTQRQLEQLLEAAQRKIRAKSEPISAGGTFAINPTPWAVEGIFRQGLNLLVGQSGAGKSRLAVACMAAWLRGDPTWLERPLHGIDPSHRHALIIGTDQTLEDWHLTLEPVGLSTRISETEVKIHDRLTLYGLESGMQFGADLFTMIRLWVDQHPNGMILIDSLAACLPPGVDEDKAGAAKPVHQLQEAIGDAWGILTHHTRKGAGKEGNLGVGAGRGSGAIDAAVSRVIGLGLIHKIENGISVAQEADPRRELLSTKRGGPTEHLIVSSDSTGFWSVHGSAEELKRQERLERTVSNLTNAQSDVLDALEAGNGWMTTRAVVEEMGETYDPNNGRSATLRKVLKRLEVLGLVESMRVGVERNYRPTPKRGQALTDEVEKNGSNGSIAAPQGISLARTVARECSKDQSEPTTEKKSTDNSSELLHSLPNCSEPPSEPPKTTAVEGSSHSRHQCVHAGSGPASAAQKNPLFPIGTAVEVKIGSRGWKDGFEVISLPDEKGVIEVQSVKNQAARLSQVDLRYVRRADQERLSRKQLSLSL